MCVCLCVKLVCCDLDVIRSHSWLPIIWVVVTVALVVVVEVGGMCVYVCVFVCLFVCVCERVCLHVVCLCECVSRCVIVGISVRPELVHTFTCRSA